MIYDNSSKETRNSKSKIYIYIYILAVIVSHLKRLHFPFETRSKCEKSAGKCFSVLVFHLPSSYHKIYRHTRTHTHTVQWQTFAYALTI